MSAVTKDVKIISPTARARLAVRSEPYYRAIQQGLALGYRRGRTGGSWIARIRLLERAGYSETKLGAADDAGAVPDGITVLSYDQAVGAARNAFAAAEARRLSGTLPAAAKASVGDVLDLYREAYLAGATRRGRGPGRDIANVDSILCRHLRPRLGAIRLERLGAERLRAFRSEIVAADRLSRSGCPIAFDTEADDFDEGEAVRRRKARANRIMTVLRAALNHAMRQGWFASDAAWREALSPYPNVSVASIRYLELDECARLLSSVEPDFGNLVRGALQTGCRYGSLRHLTCGDIDLKARSARIRVTKGGDAQTIRLKREAASFLAGLMRGRSRYDVVFAKADGSPWKPSDQQRRMARGCALAGIDPAVTFHELRDTFASHLVMAGVPLLTVSRLLGHRDTRTTEKFYAHLAPDHLQKAIDDHLPDF